MSTVQQTQNRGSLTLRDRMKSEAVLAEIAKALPKHLSAERMSRVALTAITRTPMLEQCDQASFLRCMMDLSQWGLEPDGRLAHLIPFRNNKKNIVECQLIIDYKGLVELAMRTGQISKIHADVVCDNDVFLYDRGEVKAHQIDFKNPRGNVYAAYAIVRMKDGSEKCEVLSRDEIESIRKRSKASGSGPWVTDWNEMAKKSAFRRVSKWIPLSAEIRDTLERDDDRFEAIDAVSVTRVAPKSLDDLTSVFTPAIEHSEESQVDDDQQDNVPTSPEDLERSLAERLWNAESMDDILQACGSIEYKALPKAARDRLQGLSETRAAQLAAN